ncbi:MAG: efflux RND transporter periplasmic adaptor subunit [Terriglobales bacterium]
MPLAGHRIGTRKAVLAVAALAVALAGCSRAPAAASATAPPLAPMHWGSLRRSVRVTGTIVPAHATTLLVPQLNQSQQYSQLTLSYLAPGGTRVTRGQVVASFDRTQLLDSAAEAQAQYRSLASQVEQQQAKNAADAAQRAVALTSALADERHSRLELKKGPVLTGLQTDSAKVDLADAIAHVHSLRASNAWLTKQAAATLRALDLQRDEQKQVWQRAQADSQRMVLRAPMAGMMALALPPFYGKPVPGMKLYNGVPLVRIFDPGRMLVQARISEVDLAWVPPHAAAQVRIDAYPGLVLPAHLLRLNPVAVTLLATPVHIFDATFALDGHDPRALPDLNASLQIVSRSRSGWLVPRSAVYYQRGRAYVWRRGANGRRQRRFVQVEVFAGPWIEVAAPWLSSGAQAARGNAGVASARSPGAERQP